MRTIKKLSIVSAALLVAAFSASAQTALTQTTLSAAVTAGATYFPVASATGIVATSTILYVDNEAMFVNGVIGKVIYVSRGYSGTLTGGHKSGASVLFGPPPAFIDFEPQGTCTNGQGIFGYSPIVNLRNATQWLCSSVTGKVVPGFGNTTRPPSPVTVVASAAGLVTPTGPLFHVTGTAAITGFNIPVGFDPTGGGGFCVIPDGAFTTTTANNIALASTGVVSKLLCYQFDPNANKFYPTY